MHPKITFEGFFGLVLDDLREAGFVLDEELDDLREAGFVLDDLRGDFALDDLFAFLDDFRGEDVLL